MQFVAMRQIAFMQMIQKWDKHGMPQKKCPNSAKKN